MTTSNMKRILLVDDEEDVTLVFELTLKDAGYIVDTFTDSVKALSAFQSGYYDLIILDYRMAGLNGLEFIQNVRKIDKLSKAILITAWEQSSIGIDLEKWFIKILSKPIAVDVLVEEVILALL